jgi:type II secretory pathway component PulK
MTNSDWHIPMLSCTRPARRRTGASIVILIAVFAVTMAVSGFWVSQIVQGFRIQRLREERVQARWLADAAIDRAVASLQNDRSYTGEIWQVDAAALGRKHGAEVEIVVTAAEDDSSQLQIKTQARYPDEAQPRVRITKTFVYAPVRAEQLNSLE